MCRNKCDLSSYDTVHYTTWQRRFALQQDFTSNSPVHIRDMHTKQKVNNRWSNQLQTTYTITGARLLPPTFPHPAAHNVIHNPYYHHTTLLNRRRLPRVSSLQESTAGNTKATLWLGSHDWQSCCLAMIIVELIALRCVYWNTVNNGDNDIMSTRTSPLHW